MSGVHELTGEVRNLETLDDLVRASGGGDGEGVDDSLGDSVRSIGRNGHGHESVGGSANNPITHVIDGSNSSRGSRRETTGLDDGSAALLNVRNELTLEPGIIGNLGSSLLTIDGGVRGIRVLSGRVVTPDDDVLDRRGRNAGLSSKESLGSVMVKTSHGGEVLLRDGGSASLGDEGVRVGGVSDNQNLHGLLAVLVKGSSLSAEDGGVLGQKLLALHVGSTREGSNQEGVVKVREGLLDIGGSNDT